MLQSEADPFELVGTIIAGKYEVVEVVARTALSVVYRAIHRVWQRPVAIKAFTAPTLSEAARRQLLASFVEEGRLLMNLSERCAAICQARDVSSLTTARGEWVPYTVLEWLDGECLEVVMLRERAEGVRPRTLAEVLELLNPIAEALAIAHERGIVHRDVKPGNVFILRAGNGSLPSKLLDFGVAKVVRGAGLPAATTSGPVTVTPTATESFTPSYAAPEQFSSAFGTTGPWTDVYALALILVELLTGREALEGAEFGSLALQSCNPEVRPTARALGAVVSDEVEAVLACALAVQPEERFENARALWNALRTAVARAEQGFEAGLDVTWEDDASGPLEDRASTEPDEAADEGRESFPSVPEIDEDGPTALLVTTTLPIVLKRRRAGAGPTPGTEKMK